MLITSLKIQNFRNYNELKIDFNKDVNIIYGDNAQGKTNILESIYYLIVNIKLVVRKLNLF